MKDYYPNSFPMPAVTTGWEQAKVNFQSAHTGYPVQESAKDRPQLDAHVDNLSNLPATAKLALCRLRQLADRYLGPQPDGVTGACATPSPSNLSARLELIYTDLDALLRSIHSQIDRLERF